MKQVFGKKYIKGITQFIPGEHFATMDFIDYQCQKMGMSRAQFMSFYGVSESVENGDNMVSEEEKSTDRSPIKGDAIETGLKNKSKESGVPIGILRAVMRRGMAAWESSHHAGTTQEQWGYARVNAFLEKGEGTWGNADSDLAKEVRDGGHDTKLPIKND